MHNHNTNKSNWYRGMFWMIIPCLLLIGFVFFASGNLFTGGYVLPILISIFLVAHIWMIFAGHGHIIKTEEKIVAAPAQEVKEKDEPKKGSCCHS